MENKQKEMSKGQLAQLFEIDAKQGLFAPMQRFIREVTRKPSEKLEPRVFDEHGFELAKQIDYSPDFLTIKAECGFGWNDYVTDENFKRRPFEQGVGEVQTKLHAPNRLIWSAEALIEIGEMEACAATIREGVEWALNHDVNDYPKDIVIGLLGSAQQDSDGDLGVPVLCRYAGRWYVNCDWNGRNQWSASARFLAVRRKFQRLVLGSSAL